MVKSSLVRSNGSKDRYLFTHTTVDVPAGRGFVRRSSSSSAIVSCHPWLPGAQVSRIGFAYAIESVREIPEVRPEHGRATLHKYVDIPSSAGNPACLHHAHTQQSFAGLRISGGCAQLSITPRLHHLSIVDLLSMHSVFNQSTA